MTPEFTVTPIDSSHIAIDAILDELMFKFEFTELRRHARNIDGNLTVTCNYLDPLELPISLNSVQDRTSTCIALAQHYSGIKIGWSSLLNSIYSRIRSTLKMLAAGIVVDLFGSSEDYLPPFILKPYLIEKSGTILFGPPGRGKSLTSLIMAVSIDAGISTVFEVHKQAKVLYINLERPLKSMENRLAKVNIALGLERKRSLKFINSRTHTLEDMAESIQTSIEQYCIELVIVDSMSKAGHGSLIDPDYVNNILSILHSFDTAWMLIAHSPRASEEHLFGSVMQDAAADAIVKMSAETPTENELIVSLQLTKANDIPMSIFARRIQYDMDKYGLAGIKSSMDVEIKLTDPSEPPARDKIYNYLVEFIEATVDDIREALGYSRETISRNLNDNPDLFAVVKTDNKRKVWGPVHV